LHISKKVKTLLKKDQYHLSFDTNFEKVLDNIAQHHQKYNWLKGPYLTLMQKLHKTKHSNFKLYSVELYSNIDDNLIAGEIGYVIGNTYTSLTGFSSKEKRYNNCGKLQLVLLAKVLQKKGISFWNLGHPHMEYKKKLGSLIYSRKEFLKRWRDATKRPMNPL
jgi:Leu/Phe-tRNA-protein transferase